MEERQCCLRETAQNYHLLRGAFDSVFLSRTSYSTTESALHLLGQAEWEVDFNIDEEQYAIRPIDTENPTHSAIEKLLPQIYGAPVFCSNAENIYDAILLVKNDQNEWVNVGNVNNLRVELLKSLAKPSPFGDKTARNALEITEFKFEAKKLYAGERYGKFSQVNFVELCTKIPAAVRRAFKRIDIWFRPKKINILTEGGYFKPHTGIPEDQTTIGSLVLTLPSAFTGGEFVITHSGKKHIFNFAESDKKQHWIAFYTDCTHEVRPVTSGTRITVTYSMEICDGTCRHFKMSSRVDCISYPYISPQKQEKALSDLVEVLKNSEDDYCGFVLDHRYTHSALGLGSLKGCDRILANKLKQAGFQLHFQSVLFLTHVVIGGRFRKLSHDKYVYSWTEDDMNFILGNGPKPKHHFSGVPFFRVGRLGPVISSNDVIGDQLTYNEGRETEYQKLYWNVSLIAEKPTSVWWTYVKLLLMARMKNTGEECPLGSLPLDLVKIIAWLVKPVRKVASPEVVRYPRFYMRPQTYMIVPSWST